MAGSLRTGARRAYSMVEALMVIVIMAVVAMIVALFVYHGSGGAPTSGTVVDKYTSPELVGKVMITEHFLTVKKCDTAGCRIGNVSVPESDWNNVQVGQYFVQG